MGIKTIEQRETISNLETLYKSREEVINFLETILKRKNETEGKGLKIITPKQMLQRLPIALAQVKVGNNSENLLNEIRQIVYSLNQSTQITKEAYSTIIKFINV